MPYFCNGKKHITQFWRLILTNYKFHVEKNTNCR